MKKGLWDGVLAVEVERLARGETIDQGIIAKAFKISNTKIITPIKTYDPNNEYDEEYFEFGLFMSRREYKTINRRLQTGRLLSVKEGKYVGSIAPYGYDKVKLNNNKGYTLTLNNEAATVKLIYDLYAYENLSLYEITRRLNETGRKPRKSEQWAVTTIKDILNNPVYIGKIKWNARKEIKVYKNEKIVKKRPRNKNFIIVDGLHESIIPEETWEIVKAKRSLNSPHVKHNDVIKNPLCGLIICAKCGKKMKRKSYTNKTKEPILYCDNCDNISSKLYLVEKKVIEGLQIWLQCYKIEYSKFLEELKHNNTQIINNTLKTLKLEAEREQNKMKNIYNFLEDGTYTKEIFNKRSEIISKKLIKINQSIKECQIQLEQGKKEANKPAQTIENIIDIYDLLQTPEDKNNMLRFILKQITYLKTEKSIKKDSDPTNFLINLYPKI